MAGIGHNGGPPLDDFEDKPDFSDLEGMSLEDILRAGQKALFVQLVGKARSGTASHQELAILRNALRDNGLVLGIAPAAEPASEEPADLPELGVPDWEK